jgi:DNA-directed RNA polymerase subunit K/omega
MLDQKIYLDDIYASKKCDSSSFKAVVMMSKEARFINNQAYQGFIQLEEKPTTIAMNKFKHNKLSIVANEEK